MDEVLLEIQDSVGLVTLNRPDCLNAFNQAMHHRLQEVWKEVKGNSRIRAVVVTGAGRAFTSGMDMREVNETGRFRPVPTGRVSDVETFTALNNGVWLPTIVAINGLCVGGGLHFLADADVVIASESASFIDSHVSVGHASAMEPVSLIPRIGLGNALYMAVLGRAGRLDAATALRVGLVNEVVLAEELVPRGLELAQAAAEASPAAIEATKRAIWASLERHRSEAMQMSLEVLVAHRAHPDAKEGPRAFAEKRSPRWDPTPTPAAEVLEEKSMN